MDTKSVPYSLYPRASISLCPTCPVSNMSCQVREQLKSSHASAYCARANPFFLGASENPNPGRLNVTTWKLGWSGETAVRRGSNLATSIKFPGPIHSMLTLSKCVLGTRGYVYAYSRGRKVKVWRFQAYYVGERSVY